MIGLEDRSVLAQDIEMAHRDGARLKPACAEAGITVRTLQRWKLGGGLTVGDRRPLAVRPRPAHALSAQEKETLLRVANESRFADMPPARIVPTLADERVSGILCARHNMTERSMYAKQEDDEGGCGRGGANAVDPQRTH
jgi:hypothetical protein